MTSLLAGYPTEAFTAAGSLGHGAAVPSGKDFIAGVLGGMGPESSAEFCLRLVRATPALRDQDHVRVAMWSDPRVPDRTAHLIGVGPSPLPGLLYGLERLTSLGVDVVTIVCNTAHAYLPTLRQHRTVPILDMVDSTARQCRADHGAGARIGLLGTTGTLMSGVYDEALRAAGLWAIHPDAHGQERVMEAIALLKAGDRSGRERNLLQREADRMAACGVSAVVLACTEVGLALENQQLSIPALDPMTITAQILVAMQSCCRPSSLKLAD